MRIRIHSPVFYNEAQSMHNIQTCSRPVVTSLLMVRVLIVVKASYLLLTEDSDRKEAYFNMFHHVQNLWIRIPLIFPMFIQIQNTPFLNGSKYCFFLMLLSYFNTKSRRIPCSKPILHLVCTNCMQKRKLLTKYKKRNKSVMLSIFFARTFQISNL